MIIYTLLYYTCIFIRCQRIEGDYRTKAAVVMHNPFFTSFTVGRGSFAVINKRSRLAAGRGVGAYKRRPARILWVSQTCICESFRKKEAVHKEHFLYAQPRQTNHVARQTAPQAPYLPKRWTRLNRFSSMG